MSEHDTNQAPRLRYDQAIDLAAILNKHDTEFSYCVKIEASTGLANICAYPKKQG